MYKLSPKASFLEGIGRTVDFDDNLQMFDYSDTAEAADARAIFSDFWVVGNDFITFLNSNYTRVEEKKEKK